MDSFRNLSANHFETKVKYDRAKMKWLASLDFEKQADLQTNKGASSDDDLILILSRCFNNIYMELKKSNSYYRYYNYLNFDNYSFFKNNIFEIGEIFIDLLSDDEKIEIEKNYYEIKIKFKNLQYDCILIKSINFDFINKKILSLERNINSLKKKMENTNNNENNTNSSIDDYIKAIYDIEDSEVNKWIKIINFEEIESKNNEQIKKFCEILLNGKKIDFTYNYKFKEKGKYTFHFIFNKPLTDLSYLFHQCKQLKEIDLSHFHPKNVRNMRNMFNECEKLEKIKFFDREITKKVKDMRYMFSNCKSLTNLKINFQLKNIEKMDSMFLSCSKLKNIELLPLERTMKYMFKDCGSLKEANLSCFENIKIDDMSYMFSGCTNLENIILNFNTGVNTKKKGMMNGVKKVQNNLG